MTTPAVFPYRPLGIGAGPVLMPLMPVRVANGPRSVSADALVDTGSTVNVLPYDLGLRLGFDWAAEQFVVPLGGVLASHPAKAVFLDLTVGTFAPVRLAFAWSNHPDARFLLGQTNFFTEFDACFFRARGEFHVQPRTP